MTAVVEFKVEGIPEVQRLLKQKNALVTKAALKGLIKSANLLIIEVSESILGNRAEPRSFKTGRFWRSAHHKDPDKSSLSIEVLSDVEYAKHLEYGTNPEHGRGIRARKHFRNSLWRVRGDMNDIFEEEVLNAIED